MSMTAERKRSKKKTEKPVSSSTRKISSVSRVYNKLVKAVESGRVKEFTVSLDSEGPWCVNDRCNIYSKLYLNIKYTNGKSREYEWTEEVRSGKMWMSNSAGGKLDSWFDEFVELGETSVEDYENDTDYWSQDMAGRHIVGWKFIIKR